MREQRHSDAVQHRGVLARQHISETHLLRLRRGSCRNDQVANSGRQSSVSKVRHGLSGTFPNTPKCLRTKVEMSCKMPTRAEDSDGCATAWGYMCMRGRFSKTSGNDKTVLVQLPGWWTKENATSCVAAESPLSVHTLSSVHHIGEAIDEGELRFRVQKEGESTYVFSKVRCASGATGVSRRQGTSAPNGPALMTVCCTYMYVSIGICV